MPFHCIAAMKKQVYFKKCQTLFVINKMRFALHYFLEESFPFCFSFIAVDVWRLGNVPTLDKKILLLKPNIAGDSNLLALFASWLLYNDINDLIAVIKQNGPACLYIINNVLPLLQSNTRLLSRISGRVLADAQQNNLVNKSIKLAWELVIRSVIHYWLVLIDSLCTGSLGSDILCTKAGNSQLSRCQRWTYLLSRVNTHPNKA